MVPEENKDIDPSERIMQMKDDNDMNDRLEAEGDEDDEYGFENGSNDSNEI